MSKVVFIIGNFCLIKLKDFSFFQFLGEREVVKTTLKLLKCFCVITVTKFLVNINQRAPSCQPLLKLSTVFFQSYIDSIKKKVNIPKKKNLMSRLVIFIT